MKLKRFFYLFLIAMLAVGLSLWFYLRQSPTHSYLKTALFTRLPGWQTANLKPSFAAFQRSCHLFLQQDRMRAVGSVAIHLTAEDWIPVCQAAVTLTHPADSTVKTFFQTWFQPVFFYHKARINGLFTGYYLPLLQGSLTHTAQFDVPIYGKPNDLINVDLSEFNPNVTHQQLVGRIVNNKLKPYYTREEINAGAINNSAPVLAWVSSPIDRLFLEIQGSGIIQLANGNKRFIGYAAQNGAAYTAIGQVLMNQGLMTRTSMSMQTIRAYLEAHPNNMTSIINQNKSFIFFQFLKKSAAIGAQGIELTPGYSLAVDKQWIPLGMPLWLDTTRPSPISNKPKVLQRLVIAQDTGGAIRGKVRGDVFWGAGDLATFIAGHMKNSGHYWLLLPRHRAKDIIAQFNH